MFIIWFHFTHSFYSIVPNLSFSYAEMQKTSSEKNAIPLPLQMRAAIATALGAAAANAKSLADQEHREIEHLVATIIETQVAHGFLMLLVFVHS